MNKRLQNKCDKLMNESHTKEISYSSLIAEIDNNKQLSKVKTAIPNAIDYIIANGYTVVKQPTKQFIAPKPVKAYRVNPVKNKIHITPRVELLDQTEEQSDDEISDIGDEFLPYRSTVSLYLDNIQNLTDKLLTPEEERYYLQKAQEGDISARNILITRNLRLVISIAKKYVFQNNSLALDDLIQIGNFGLIHAIEKYDLSKDVKFATYATFWIKQHIMRALHTESSSIRLPVHTMEQIRYIKKAILALQNSTKSDDLPSIKSITDYCNEHKLIASNSSKRSHGLTESDVLTCLKYYTLLYPTSLNIPVSDEDDSLDLIDFVENDEEYSIDDNIMLKSLQDNIDNILAHYLTERERSVIRLRFGFDGNDPLTLEKIAQMYHLSRERIRQIERTAIRKIRRNKTLMYELKDYLE